MTKFLYVECKECKNKQIVYNHSTTKVRCHECNVVLTKPKGGKCELLARLIEAIR